MAKKPNKEYVAKNIKFLQDIAEQDNTKKLPKDVMYKEIHSVESSKHPSLSDVVSVHYTGKLVSGKVFDSTRNNSYPETFRLREVIEGWQIALSEMSVGDIWEIYIPSEVGYGDRTMDDIPGGSTLIFEVELLRIN